MKHLLLITYFILLCTIGVTSCRSHQESAVAESSFVEVASTVQVNEKLTNVSETKMNSSLSFDSIEIFIQRNWNSSYSPEKYSSVWLGFPQGELMATSDSLRISSTSEQALPYSEIIGIKAYNAKAASSSHSQDSLSASIDSSLAINLSMESQKEETGSSHSVAVYDPPDLMAVVVWAFIIVAAILIIVYFIKRKSNP